MDSSFFKEADTWSLQSDQKLLQALMKFSTSICDKSSILTQRVDDLCSDAVEVESSLRNTFNEFLILGDTHFIENVSSILFIFLFWWARLFHMLHVVYLNFKTLQLACPPPFFDAFKSLLNFEFPFSYSLPHWTSSVFVMTTKMTTISFFRILWNLKNIPGKSLWLRL